MELDEFVSPQSISELHQLVREYSFIIRHAKTVRVKVWLSDRDYGGDCYIFTLSHYLHGPKQAGPYIPSAPYGKTEELALEAAVRALSSFFPAEGEFADQDPETWFVANEDF